jgi:UDP-glucose-4-epimerase GalE
MIAPGAAILVTGGAGYIGAHTCKALRESGYVSVVYDDLSAGYAEAVQWGELVVGDIRDRAKVRAALSRFDIKAVIHFAGLIEVGRSVREPELFHDVNVAGLGVVLEAMKDCGVDRIVFSSSAAVYGHQAASGLLREGDPKSPASPYGETKLKGEQMIAAFAEAYGVTGVALRYFNAAGADACGLIGEAHEPETHLIPLAVKAALGAGPALTVFGADFATPDGSCLRDYVHVTDLAAAHLAALSMPRGAEGFAALNLGTGQGRSVLEVIAAVERAVGRPAPYALGARRQGDPARLVADPSLAGQLLGWRPLHSSLDEIVRSAAAWGRAPAYGRR